MTQWGLDTLFNPAKRHMDEEKLRLQSTREEVGDASGGKRIDLDSGKVRISKPATARSEAGETPAVRTAGENAALSVQARADESSVQRRSHRPGPADVGSRAAPTQR